MRHMKLMTQMPFVCAVIGFGSAAGASGARFSDYTPLPSSAGPTPDEAAPITTAFRVPSALGIKQ